MFPGLTELRLIGCSIELIWILKSKTSTSTPKTNSLTFWQRKFHTWWVCLFNISHFSSAECSEVMSKRTQKESSEERVTAKSRPMMNLIARSSERAPSALAFNGIHRSRSRFIHPQWRKVKGKKINIWDASQDRQPEIESSLAREILRRSMPATFDCWKIRFQDWSLYLFAISYGSDTMDQRSGDGWFSGWFDVFVICKRKFECQILRYSMRGLLQPWKRSSIILTSKEAPAWRNKGPEAGPFPSRKRDRVKTTPQKTILAVWISTKNSSTSQKLNKLVQRQQLNWLHEVSQIEDDGEKKYRARFTK